MYVSTYICVCVLGSVIQYATSVSIAHVTTIFNL